MGRFRLLPLMAFAALCLFGLKFAGFLFAEGHTLSGVAPASAQNKEADPAAKPPETAEETDAATREPAEAGDKTAEKTGDKKAKDKKKDKAAEAELPSTQDRSEVALLKSLGKRRKSLEKRERELQLRENLLQAAEKRIEARISELKGIESRISAELKSQDQERESQFGRLVKVYSGMKPKSAAKIFNKLDMDVLLGLVKRMRPRATSAIMAAMDTDAAQRLTLEIAKRSQAEDAAAAALPKIKGRAKQ